MTIGERIKQARKARGWTQRDLSVAAGMWPQDVARFESGANEPRADKLVAISKALGVTPNDLLGFEDCAAQAANN